MSHLTSFGVVDAVDRSQWLAAWERSAAREPALHPTYAALFANTGDETVCLSYVDEGGSVLFPLLLRSIPNTQLCAIDAASPYGYGGPTVAGTPDAGAFWDAVDAWARDRGIVSLVARLSLFDSTLVPWRGEVLMVMENVVRSLGDRDDALLASYEHKVRKNVHRAQREGLRVEISTAPSRFNEFYRIYIDTMVRRGASAAFRFPESFFETIHNEMPGTFLYGHVLHNDVVIASELVLRSNVCLYSFLGGTDELYFPLRPNDFLKHTLIEWGAEHHLSAFVLGGGPAPNDGVFRYKRSFAPTGVMPFHIGTRVYRPETYDALARARLRARTPGRTSALSALPFFPSYRADSPRAAIDD